MTRIIPSTGWSEHMKTGPTGWSFFRWSRGSIGCVKTPDLLICCIASTEMFEDGESRIEGRRFFVAERQFDHRPAFLTPVVRANDCPVAERRLRLLQRIDTFNHLFFASFNRRSATSGVLP